MARKVRVLGWFHIIISSIGLLIALAFCGQLATEWNTNSELAATIMGMIVLAAAICILPGLIGGIGLLKRRRWGRVVIIIVSAFYLIWVPIGTVFGGLGLWVLLGRDAEAVFSRSSALPPVAFYSGGRAPRPPITFGLLLMIAGVGAGFIVALGAGFMWSGAPAPAEISTLFYPALAVLSFAIAYAIRHLATQGRRPALPNLNPPWSPIALAQEASARRKTDEAQRQRLARLAADPRRHKYVPLIERGESWSDEQIDYDLDPSKTVTCQHLRAVEHAMRSQGVRVKRHPGPQAGANCVVDRDRLKRNFGPGAAATYREFEHYERSLHDPMRAQFWCSACTSAIEVAHAKSAAPGTPVFPR